MNWQEILIVLVPLLVLMAWIYNRIDKKMDAMSSDVKSEFKSINMSFGLSSSQSGDFYELSL